MNLLSPNRPVGPFVVGEKPAPIQYQFLDALGAPLPLVGYTVKFVVRERDAVAATPFAASLFDGANGIVSYTWTGAEFLTPGSYLAEFWAGNTVQRFASWLITFDVRQPVGAVPNI